MLAYVTTPPTARSAIPWWPETLGKPTKLQKHLLGPHQARSTATIGAFLGTGEQHHRSWAQLLANCCRTAWIAVDSTTSTSRPWILRCGSRLCSFCGRGRSARVAEQVHRLVRTMKEPKHLVLTWRTRSDPLSDQFRGLRAALTQLRHRPQWQNRVRGGVYTLEAKRKPATRMWHVHLHLIIDSSYFPQPLLSKLWRECVDDGSIVYIRQITSTKAASWEISKYVGKPPNSLDWIPSATVAYADAVHRTRLLQTFGCYHGHKLPQGDEPPTEQPQAEFINIPGLAYLAAAGEPIAMDLAAIVWSRWPMYRSYLEAVCPVSTATDQLQTSSYLSCPLPKRSADDRWLPHTDPADLAALDTALFNTCQLWFTMLATGHLDLARGPPDQEE